MKTRILCATLVIGCALLGGAQARAATETIAGAGRISDQGANNTAVAFAIAAQDGAGAFAIRDPLNAGDRLQVYGTVTAMSVTDTTGRVSGPCASADGTVSGACTLILTDHGGPTGDIGRIMFCAGRTTCDENGAPTYDWQGIIMGKAVVSSM